MDWTWGSKLTAVRSGRSPGQRIRSWTWIGSGASIAACWQWTSSHWWLIPSLLRRTRCPAWPWSALPAWMPRRSRDPSPWPGPPDWTWTWICSHSCQAGWWSNLGWIHPEAYRPIWPALWIPQGKAGWILLQTLSRASPGLWTETGGQCVSLKMGSAEKKRRKTKISFVWEVFFLTSYGERENIPLEKSLNNGHSVLLNQASKKRWQKKDRVFLHWPFCHNDPSDDWFQKINVLKEVWKNLVSQNINLSMNILSRSKLQIFIKIAKWFHQKIRALGVNDDSLLVFAILYNSNLFLSDCKIHFLNIKVFFFLFFSNLWFHCAM